MSYQAHRRQHAHHGWKDVRPNAEVNEFARNHQNMARTLAEMMNRHDCGSGSKGTRPKDKIDKRVDNST